MRSSSLKPRMWMPGLVLAALLATAGQRSCSADDSLAAFGLQGLNRITDAQAMQVRGMSSRSYSMGVASLSALIFDPATGTQVNIDIANFSNSESTGSVSTASSSAVEGVVGFTGLDIQVGGFRASLSPGALFFGGQSGAGGGFSVNSLNVPRFN